MRWHVFAVRLVLMFAHHHYYHNNFSGTPRIRTTKSAKNTTCKIALNAVLVLMSAQVKFHWCNTTVRQKPKFGLVAKMKSMPNVLVNALKLNKHVWIVIKQNVKTASKKPLKLAVKKWRKRVVMMPLLQRLHV